MAFTHVQLIYHRAHTDARNPPIVPRLSALDEANRQVRHFVRVVRHIIATRNPQIDHQPTTLKVLLAPEFYFRHPHGQYDGTGHFRELDVALIGGCLLRELGGTPAQPILRGHSWIVIPGTVIWSYLVQSPDHPDRHAIMNTILLLDFSRDEVAIKRCDKQNFSITDNLNTILNGAMNGVVRPEAAQYHSSQTHIAGGVRIGMEIRWLRWLRYRRVPPR